ncbi:Cytochrome b-c1 complex subunit 8, mitochondrial [Diatrype stigma]|uniref:Cytochrome b-c1 complex subunit 8 n=1 Tax=Diatrype stigma TaxID=117547 RepID=A0AAN9U8Y3_9PEZI
MERRENSLAGAAYAAVFNTWRRFRTQVLYWAPPLIAAYYCMKWTDERYVVSLATHPSIYKAATDIGV